MGHNDSSKTTLTHRDAVATQHRTATFGIVFSVFLVLLIVTLSAVQERDATCQERVHEAAFDIILQPNLTREEIYAVISDVLTARHGALDISPAEASQHKTKTLELLDTSSRAVTANGFRLLRRSDDNSYRFELRALFDRLCEAYPTISMEALPNVDYEHVTYRRKAIVLRNSTMKYMLESTLLTKDPARITTFASLQNIFPGFHQVSGSGRLVTLRSWTYTVGGTATVYFNGRPLDVMIQIQQWFDKGSNPPLFWRVSVSTDNINAEPDAVSVQSLVRAAFTSRRMTCSGSVGACDSDFDIYFR